MAYTERVRRRVLKSSTYMALQYGVMRVKGAVRMSQKFYLLVKKEREEREERDVVDKEMTELDFESTPGQR